MTTEVARQVADDLERSLSAPVRCLLGLDLAEILEERIRSHAPILADRMIQDDDIAAQTVIDIMGTLWPNCAPEDCGQADWWRTPLGRVCARSLGRTDTGSVSHSVAGAMLGITRGSIAQMVHRGTLDRHPNGGVLRASVLQRIGR